MQGKEGLPYRADASRDIRATIAIAHRLHKARPAVFADEVASKNDALMIAEDVERAAFRGSPNR